MEIQAERGPPPVSNKRSRSKRCGNSTKRNEPNEDALDRLQFYVDYTPH